jgi:hypothetical protein
MQKVLAVLIVVASVAPGVVATLVLTTQNVTNPTARWLLVMTAAGPIVVVIVFAVGLIVAALRSPKSHEPLDPDNAYPPV